MTIQEKAIEQLERVSKHLATIGEKEDYIGVAIQALEQECEDAISRKAVLDIVRFEENWLSDAKSNNADTDIAFSGIRTQIAKLSPVTKALEPCKDAVSRQAVLNTLSRMDSVLDEDRTVETYKELLVACYKIAAKIPHACVWDESRFSFT